MQTSRACRVNSLDMWVCNSSEEYFLDAMCRNSINGSNAAHSFEPTDLYCTRTQKGWLALVVVWALVVNDPPQPTTTTEPLKPTQG